MSQICAKAKYAALGSPSRLAGEEAQSKQEAREEMGGVGGRVCSSVLAGALPHGAFLLLARQDERWCLAALTDHGLGVPTSYSEQQLQHAHIVLCCFAVSSPWMMILLRSLWTMAPVCARPASLGTTPLVLSSHPSSGALDTRYVGGEGVLPLLRWKRFPRNGVAPKTPIPRLEKKQLISVLGTRPSLIS